MNNKYIVEGRRKDEKFYKDICGYIYKYKKQAIEIAKGYNGPPNIKIRVVKIKKILIKQIS